MFERALERKEKNERRRKYILGELLVIEDGSHNDSNDG